MVTGLRLSQACEGMIREKAAIGRSSHTIADYRVSFRKLLMYFEDDPSIASIARKQLVDFFAWLQHEYVSEPDGVAPRGKIRLSPKSIRNIHTNLSALWTWSVQEEFVAENIVSTIEKPRFSPPEVIPLTKDDLVRLLGACDKSRTWKTRSSSASRPTSERDKAIIKLLLDTGIRASELCEILFQDLNLRDHTLIVRGKGPGRGHKERVVHLSKSTGQSVWKYLLPRMETIRETDNVFVVGTSEEWRPMTRHVLWKLLKRIGERAGVNNVYPHKFRHTFGIAYLRNGGDLFTLQDLLGHSDLSMVRRYARIAQVDRDKAHRIASPVKNWRL